MARDHHKLKFITAADHERLEPRFQELVRGLHKLIEALDARLRSP